ncbi:MAG: ABC transporter permease [Polyangiaceae bacterium]
MRYLAARLGWALFVVWAVVTITFFVEAVLPADPARIAAGAQARPADVARIRTQLGLDKPIGERYAIYLRRLVHLAPTGSAPDKVGSELAKEHAGCVAIGPLHIDLGKSYEQRRPVATILAERLPRTALLAVCAVFVQLWIGVFCGIFAATRKGTKVDTGVIAVSLLGVSAPTFIIGLLLQFVFGHKLRWLPLDGFGQTTLEHAESVILPALTLGIFGAAFYTRLVRDEMIVLLRSDYVRTASAKGASRIRVVFVHAFRNALVPLATVVALDLGTLVGGAIVTETLFRWPGLGALSVTALIDRDGPVVMGTVLVTSCAIVLANLVADAAHIVLDPTLRKTTRV